MKLTFGLTVMLIGLATVFVGLILLIAIIKVISAIVRKMESNKNSSGASAKQTA